MFRADHFTGNRRGGVCIYYKEYLPIKMLNITAAAIPVVLQNMSVWLAFWVDEWVKIYLS